MQVVHGEFHLFKPSRTLKNKIDFLFTSSVCNQNKPDRRGRDEHAPSYLGTCLPAVLDLERIVGKTVGEKDRTCYVEEVAGDGTKLSSEKYNFLPVTTHTSRASNSS